MCILEEGDCPEACEGVVNNNNNNNNQNNNQNNDVKSGKLTVTNEKNEDGMVFSSGYVSELDTINFSSDEEVTINSITLKRVGLSSRTSIEEIWLENEEGKKVTTEKSINSSDMVTLSINKDYRTIDGKASFVVVVKTPNKKTTELGTNIGFEISEIDSTAKNASDKTSTNKYAFADYTAKGVKIEIKGNPTTYDYKDGESYEVAKMKINATDVAVKVEWFTLNQTGTNSVDLDDIDDVEVLVNGTSIKGVNWSVKKSDLTITFPEQEIAQKANAIFTVKASFKDFTDFGKNIQFHLDAANVNIKEVNNNVRVNVTGADTDFVAYTFKGNRVEFVNEKLDSSIDIAANSKGIIAKGTVKTNGQTIEAKNVSVSTDTFTGIDTIEFLVNGNPESEISNRNTAHTWGTFSSITIDDNSTIELRVTLVNDAQPTNWIQIKINNETSIWNSLGAQYDVKASDKSINSLGSITIAKFNVQAPKSSFVNNLSKGVEFKTNTNNEKTIFEGNYTAKKQAIKLNQVQIKHSDSTHNVTWSVELIVKIGNETVASIVDKTDDRIDDTNGKTADFNPIEVKEGDNIPVVIIAKGNPTESITGLVYKVALIGYDSEYNEIGKETFKETVELKFVTANAVTVMSNSAIKSNDVILNNRNQVVASFIVKPSNNAESAEFDSMVLSLSGFGTTLDPDKFTVTIGGIEQDVTTGNITTWLYIDNINQTISKDGVNVEVKYQDKVGTGDKTVKVESMNNDAKNGGNTFTRTSVNALLKVAEMDDSSKATTQYKFTVEYADDVDTQELTGVVFWKWSTYSGSINDGGKIEENKRYSLENQSTAQIIDRITYGDVEIIKSSVSDFFRVKNQNGKEVDLIVSTNS